MDALGVAELTKALSNWLPRIVGERMMQDMPDRAVVLMCGLVACCQPYGLDDATLAVFVIRPNVSESMSTVIVYCFEAPAAIVPRVHVGTPTVSSTQPEVVGLLTPAGSVSVTTAFCASDGPLFCAVTV